MAQPSGTETPDVRILSAAVPPGSPSGPNVKMITGAGGLSGLLLGCLLAFTRRGSVDVFESGPDLMRATGLPVLASFPRAFTPPGRRALVGQVVAAPSGPAAEALRKLRAKLRFIGRNKAPRCVVFSDAMEGRGKQAASIAAAFARVAAADGERVLLIEGDLGTPAIGNLINTNMNGLSHVLEGRMDWRDAVEADFDSPLDLLLVGSKITNSHRLLSGVAFQNLLVEAKQDYDLVVMDAPAATSTDTAALVLRSDATVLLVDARTEQPDVREAAARLSQGNAAPLAIVMINVG
jgi:receptor protein-tyrosine kinase